jgi:hypothetical protein
MKGDLASRFNARSALNSSPSNHCGVTRSPAVAPGGPDKLLNLPFGQMLAWSKLGIGTPTRRNCPFLFCWRYEFEPRFCHVLFALGLNLCCRRSGTAPDGRPLPPEQMGHPDAAATGPDGDRYNRRPDSTVTGGSLFRVKMGFWHRIMLLF